MVAARMNIKSVSTHNVSRVGVIVVTFNSELVLGRCIESILNQSRVPETVIVVDNCSVDQSYLEFLSDIANCQVVRLSENGGFCRGNNRGYACLSGTEYVLFLNPDAFLARTFIEDAVAAMEDPANSRVGALSGALLGFDVVGDRPTGKVDSLGIFQTWYGKWYDRGQGAAYPTHIHESSIVESVPALCGALMFCRGSALEEVMLRGTEIFDDTFFMYKEDIDLSLRLRRKGWTMGFCGRLHCYHGRGWTSRRKMLPFFKYLSARNELRVSLRNHAKGFVYSSLKFLYVCIVEMAFVPGFERRDRIRNRPP
jgi:N-acetylglucosaminyl-diphospho-decaprenol L-rhamnosyltransferase